MKCRILPYYLILSYLSIVPFERRSYLILFKAQALSITPTSNSEPVSNLVPSLQSQGDSSVHSVIHEFFSNSSVCSVLKLLSMLSQSLSQRFNECIKVWQIVGEDRTPERDSVVINADTFWDDLAGIHSAHTHQCRREEMMSDEEDTDSEKKSNGSLSSQKKINRLSTSLDLLNEANQFSFEGQEHNSLTKVKHFSFWKVFAEVLSEIFTEISEI